MEKQSTKQNIAVLGTGMVGQTLATALLQKGHAVFLGSRNTNNETSQEWLKSVIASESAEPSGALHKASIGTFQEAAKFGEIIINATNGAHSLSALKQAGHDNLKGKILIDVANPLEQGKDGMQLFTSNSQSLGEQIQEAFPDTQVVKTLNTITAPLMLNPSAINNDHVIFISSNFAVAKQTVIELLGSFGWTPTEERIIDLGDIKSARGTEAYLLLWLRMWGTFQTANFNISINR